MAEGLTIEATIQDVEFDPTSGWYTLVSDQGKFSTKIRENAEEALRLKGSRAFITYTENVVTKPSPDGSEMRTYRNRYLSRASEAPATATTPGGFSTSGQPAAAPAPVDGAPAGMTQTEGRKTPREDAWRMCLNKGGELAVLTMPLMPNEQRSFEVQKQIALAWAKFFLFTPVPMEIAGTQVSRPPTPQEAYENEPAAVGGGYPHSDSDIPF